MSQFLISSSSPKTIRSSSLRCILLLALALLPNTAHTQGCTQCKDSTAATPPATQSAYRTAILFLATSAGTIFVATAVILRRQR